MSTPRGLISSFLVGAGSLTLATAASGQSGTSVYEGDWPEYHGDHFAQRYSPLDQINAENVGDLEIAWQFSTQNFGPSTDFNNPSTPIEINGVLYANIGSTRNVVALDATTGQVLWLWRPQEGERFDEAPRKGAGRGVAYWTDGDKKRVIDVTPGYHLVSLDANLSANAFVFSEIISFAGAVEATGLDAASATTFLVFFSVPVKFIDSANVA